MNAHQTNIRPSRIDAIKAIYERGMSAQELADALCRYLREPITRNSVMGLYHRNREALEGHPLKGTRASHARKAGTTKAAAERKKREEYRKTVEYVEVEKFEGGATELARDDYDTTSLNIGIMDLGMFTCRWPTGGDKAETLFCGHRTHQKSSYCRHHRLRARGNSIL